MLADLPDTALTDRIVPPGSGLLAWSTPVDGWHRLAAASWTPRPDGWHVICYGSLGPDLPADAVETIRHQIGWLLPVHARHVTRDHVVNGDNPLAGLTATWLIIAQQLTRDEATPADPPIRRACAQARRPTPEIRTLRIKGPAARPKPSAVSELACSGRATLDHRYWVSGHERNQEMSPARQAETPAL